MKTVIINKFDGGIVNDPRTQASGIARMISSFDNLTDSNRLTPYRNSEAGDTLVSDHKIRNFLIALRIGTPITYSLYGLGNITGSALAKVMYKDLTTGADNDLDDADWTNTTSEASSAGNGSYNLFVYYKKTGLVYGARANTTIWSYNPAGGSWVDSARPIAYINLAQGIVHSKDDVMYIPYDNKIASYNSSAWVDAALTLPTDLYITSICEYGNYLAIGCAPLSGVGHSRVFLWDRDSSLPTLSDSIDWGEENLKVLEEIDGVLVGVALSGGNTTRFKDRVIFRYLSVSKAVKFSELVGETIVTQLPIAKQKINNRIYFMMKITINGTLRQGVWSVGRPSLNSPFSVVHERTPNNDTALTNGVFYNFFYAGDFLFMSYDDNGTESMTKTNDTETYTATSTLETTINPNMEPLDRLRKKQLISVTVGYEAIPTSGQVILKYKVDGGSYTTVATDTTVASRFLERTALDAGTQFTSGREYEFRIESKGTPITSLTYKYKALETNI
jgi:hypothetical protein